MNPPPAEIGASIADIDTPALVVDLDAFDRNVAEDERVLARAAGAACGRTRRRTKAPAIALKQIAQGAVGQCCAEGRRGRGAGARRRQGRPGQQPDRIGSANCAALRALARGRDDRGCVLTLPSKSTMASRVAQDFGVELGALVEIEVGMERCGVVPGKDGRRAWRAASRKRRASSFVACRPITAGAAPTDASAARAGDRLRGRCGSGDEDSARRLMNLDCEIVTGAGTGTFVFEAESGVYNELQVGSYVFMDTDYARIGNKDGGLYTAFEHSLFVPARRSSARRRPSGPSSTLASSPTAPRRVRPGFTASRTLS